MKPLIPTEQAEKAAKEKPTNMKKLLFEEKELENLCDDFASDHYEVFTDGNSDREKLKGFAREILDIGNKRHAESLKDQPFVFSDSFSTLHPDTQKMLIYGFISISDKMRRNEVKYGYSNEWKTQDWRDECGSNMLNHIEKGDPVDPTIYGLILMARNWSTIGFIDKYFEEALSKTANTAYNTDVVPVLLACNLHLHDLKTTLEIIIEELPKLAETISAKKDLEKVKSTLTQLTELLKP